MVRQSAVALFLVLEREAGQWRARQCKWRVVGPSSPPPVADLRLSAGCRTPQHTTNEDGHGIVSISRELGLEIANDAKREAFHLNQRLQDSDIGAVQGGSRAVTGQWPVGGAVSGLQPRAGRTVPPGRRAILQPRLVIACLGRHRNPPERGPPYTVCCQGNSSPTASRSLPGRRFATGAAWPGLLGQWAPTDERRRQRQKSVPLSRVPAAKSAEWDKIETLA